MWRDASYYPTRDGIIPFICFWAYMRALHANLAFERIAAAGGIRALGTFGAQMFGKNGSELPESLRSDLRAAYIPE